MWLSVNISKSPESQIPDYGGAVFWVGATSGPSRASSLPGGVNIDPCLIQQPGAQISGGPEKPQTEPYYHICLQ